MVSQIREVIDLVVDNEMEVVDIDDNDDEVEAVDIADDNDVQIVDIAVDGDDEIDVDNADYDDEVEVIARDDIVLLEIDELDSDIEQADSAYGGGSDDEYHDVREDLLDRRQLNRLNREAVYCVNYIYFTENHRSKYCVSCYFDVREMFEGLRKKCGHYSERFIAMRGIFCTNCGGPLHQIVTRDMCPTCLNVYRTDYINECAVNNGGCSEVCENTEGSFFCACDGDEKALSADGKSCTDINNLACAPLDPAGRGFLMCSKETTPRMRRDVKRAAIRPGTKCYLKCPIGYQLHGEYQLTCQGDGTWDGPKHGECVKYSKPRLECPKDVVAEISPDHDEAFVTFDQPSTDLDWFRYVRSKPSWGTRLEASLKPGLHLVTFFARHPVSKKQASCVLRIIVKEGEAPKVNNCPSDITGKNGTSFTWTEPTFSDNVSVTRASNNESPGKSFGIGEWKIVYEASDEAGWTTRCVFSVVVHQD